MSGGLVGKAEEQPYIKIRHRGVDYFFPLDDNPDRPDDPDDINTSTLESFSPSTIAGDPSLVSNELLAVLLSSNWQGGMGTIKYQEQEGTGSLDSFYYSTLDTRFQNMAILPPRRISLGTLPTTTAQDADFIFGNRDFQPQLLCWYTGPGGTPRIAAGSTNTTTQVTSWTSTTLASVTQIRQIIAYNGLYVAATDTAIWTSPDMTTWTARWTSTGGFFGLVQHDNKIYTVRASDNKLYWTLDPTTGTGVVWPNVSVDPLRLDPFETVSKLTEWKNRQDTRSLFILTTQRIVAWDDDGYWAEFFPKGQIGGGTADLSVWPQDKAMYFAPFDNGSNVLQFQNQTISNVGPNKKGGLGLALGRIVRRLRGSLNFLFGLGYGSLSTSYLGALSTGTQYTYGQVMVYNGQGWHTIVEGTSTDPISSMSIFKDQVVFLRGSSNVETIFTPDAPQAPIYINGPMSYAEGSFYLESADLDAGLENIYKTARYFELIIDGSDGTAGIPANHLYSFEYSLEGSGVWFALATNQGPGVSKLIRLPVTTGTYSDARGVPFIKIRWRVTLTKSAGANAGITPILRSVALYYLRANDLIDGIQFRIDLSPKRVQKMMTSLGLGGTYNGKTPQRLRTILQEIKRSKYNPSIEYGPPNNRIVIPAAEIRVSQQENVRTGVGIYTITARDVSTQITTLSY